MMSTRSICVVVLASLAFVAGCSSKTGSQAGKTNAPAKPATPTRPPRELVAGVWDTYLKVDVPAFAKQRAASEGISLEEARRKGEEIDGMLDPAGLRVHITWQFEADGTLIVRRKLSGKGDAKGRRRFKWKVLSTEGHSTTLEVTNTTGAKESRQITVTFQTDDRFRLDKDPQLKGLWLVPVLNPIFERNNSGSDLKQVHVPPKRKRVLPTVPVGNRWPDAAAALAEAPQVERKTHEVKREDETFLIEAPKDAVVEAVYVGDGAIKLKLASGGVAKFIFGRHDMRERQQTKRQLSGYRYDLKEFSFAGKDLLIVEMDTNKPKRFSAYMNVSDGLREFQVWLDNTDKNSSDLTLPDVLLLLNCARTLRPKKPYPKAPLAILERLDITHQPETDDPAKVTSLWFPNYTPSSYVAFVEHFPNLESVGLSVKWLEPSADALRPLSGCDKLKKLVIRLASNSLTDATVQALSQCRSLEELDANVSALTRAGYAPLGTMAGLKVLRLHCVDDKAIEGLGDLAGLKVAELLLDIRAYGEFPHEETMSFLKELSNLRRLSIEAPVTGVTFKTLAGLTRLQSLAIESRTLTDEHIASLAGLAALKELSLKGTDYAPYLKDVKATGATLDQLAAIKSLEVLKLSGMTLNDDAMQRLQKLKSLRELSLEKTGVTFQGLIHLKDCPQLRRLHLAGQEKLNEVLIDDFKKAAPKVEVD